MIDQVTKLAELLKKADENSALKGITDYEDALIDNAEYLVANGVVVLDMKVLSLKNIPLVTHFANMPLDEVFELVKAKQQGRVLKLPCNVGDTVYIIEREDGEAEDYTGYMFLAQTANAVIVTPFINDYDVEETIEDLIQETAETMDVDLCVFPLEDCYTTKEDAKTALKGSDADND